MQRHEHRLTAAEAMYAALKNLPCRCEFNVPYTGMKVERVVTLECARCRSMAAWKLATEGEAKA
jgi:hypothetical protein